MSRLLIFISLLLIFVSCEQNRDRDSIDRQTNSITTISGIQHIYTNYKEALNIAKRDNKPIFILFTAKHCRWCKKLKNITFKNKEIIKRLNDEFIVLLLDKNYSEYPSKYNVNAVPNVYIINNNEKVFTSIVGYHKNQYDYIKWFNYVKVELSD